MKIPDQSVIIWALKDKMEVLTFEMFFILETYEALPRITHNLPGIYFANMDNP